MANLFNVHDLFCPSPISLEEIAVTNVAIEVWRREIRRHRMNNSLDTLDFGKDISSNILNPHVPLKILPIIEKYMGNVRLSIKKWLDYHNNEKLFHIEVLRNFDDFVGDFNGTIHYVRTVKQMMRCDGISDTDKFKIACVYCLEDDIARIWPSVKSQFDLNEIVFELNPLLYYWICRLRNQLYKLPPSTQETVGTRIESMDERLLKYVCDHRIGWSSSEYFWNRLDYGNRMQYVEKVFRYSKESFTRYVLAKFSEEDLNQFLDKHGKTLLYSFYDFHVPSPFELRSVMATWMYIQHKTKENDFNELIINILTRINHHPVVTDICDFWKCSPDILKQSAIQHVLLADHVFHLCYNRKLDRNSAGRASFLLTALSDAALEDRRSFWELQWSSLIRMIYPDDLRLLITLCFKDENEIIEFKKRVLSKYENIGRVCLRLLRKAQFEVLNDFLAFCCPEDQSARAIRLSLLSQNFALKSEYIEKVSSMNEFISGAYEDADCAADLKNQLLLTPASIEILKSSIIKGQLQSVMELIDTFVSSQQVAMDIKEQHILPAFRQFFVTDGRLLFQGGINFIDFSFWCLGNDDKVAEFKRTLPIDGIVQAVIRGEMLRKRNDPSSCGNLVRSPMTYYPELVEFLEWYFVTPEAIAEFEEKYADDDVFVRLITK